MELLVTIRNKRAAGDGQIIVCDNDDYTVRFDWDAEWDGLSPMMLVVCHDGTTYSRPVLGGVAALPYLRAKCCMIGLVAGDMRTTTGALYLCTPSVRDGSGTYSEPPEDVYSQLLAMFTSKISAPAEDGAAGQVLMTDGVGGVYWGNGGSGGGANGITPHIGENGNWYLGDEDTGVKAAGTDGEPGKDGSPGEPGIPGKDGHTPEITAEKSGTATTIKADGVAIATINDGEPGKDGSPGAPGQDGAPGKDGADGQSGADGVSPTVAISKTGKQTTITITDAQGAHTATIVDGADGATGATGATGENGKDGYTPQRGVDYWTAEDKAEINGYIAEQMPDLSGYATEQYVAEEIAKAQLGGGGGTTTVTKTLTAADFEIGSLSSSEGTEITHSKRICTDYLECTKDEPYSVAGNGSDRYRVFFYDPEKAFLGASDFQASGVSSVFSNASGVDDTAYVRFVLSYNDATTAITEIADLANRFTITRTYNQKNPVIDTSVIVTQSELKKALEAYDVPTKGKNLLIFGDSITETATVSDDGATYTEGVHSNWPFFAKDKLQIGEMWNYAKSGARCTDFETESVRQKLSHQIETAIANNRPADIIVISAGTNDNYSDVTDTFDTAMEKDIADLDRTVFSEALRWEMYTLRNAYPEAICFIATPIQRAAKEIYSSLIAAMEHMAHRYNFIVIPAHDESGIVRDFEVKGGSGRDLSDGLHPNENGQKKMANLYCACILRHITKD